MWGGIGALGIASGPSLGAFAITLTDWRAAFWINLPICVGMFIAGRRVLIETPRVRQRTPTRLRRRAADHRSRSPASRSASPDRRCGVGVMLGLSACCCWASQRFRCSCVANAATPSRCSISRCSRADRSRSPTPPRWCSWAGSRRTRSTTCCSFAKRGATPCSTPGCSPPFRPSRWRSSPRSPGVSPRESGSGRW